MPPDMLRRVLECTPPDLILVGGQALAYWIGYYDIPEPDGLGPAISRDVDFLTSSPANSKPLVGFARAIGGRSIVQPPEAISALVGSAVAPADDDSVHNVDLLHRVVGLDRAEIEAHAVTVSLPGSTAPIRAMHPVHVLQSRNANLHTLASKQDEIGCKQFALAIAVARAYLEGRIDEIERRKSDAGNGRRRAALAAIKRVVEYSGEDAAKKMRPVTESSSRMPFPPGGSTFLSSGASNGRNCASACHRTTPGGVKSAQERPDSLPRAAKLPFRSTHCWTI